MKQVNNAASTVENVSVEEALGLYCQHMEQIKLRTNNAARVVNKSLIFENDTLAYEYASVQLRKILELIAFSSLVANKEIYSDTHKNFKAHWKAKNILKELEKINPDFYPRPGRITFGENNSHHIELLSNIMNGKGTPLTKEEFETLYDTCSKILHIPNPYQGNILVDFIHDIDGWLKKIAALLDTHQITLINDTKWLIIMSMGNDKKARGFQLVPQTIQDVTQNWDT